MENEYLLYWEVPEKEKEFYKFFQSHWDALGYAENFDHHVINARIYKLDEEIVVEEESENG